jgi:predicted methyltransferase
MVRFKHSYLLALFATTALLTGANTHGANAALEQVIDSRAEQDKARDSARHPAQTLEFFGVTPGMVVAEALPTGGWYSNILANYLGADGTLYGVNYPDQIWPMFSFSTPEMVSKRIDSTKQFPKLVAGFTDNGINARGFTFNTVPTEILGTVDRVLLIRALHNLNRFDATTGLRSQALAAVHAMLKDDGIVGVVQHRAPANAADAGADGSRGYLKQATVIGVFEEAGFELIATSEINANPKDKPGPEDIVWRLPPSFSGSKDDPERKKAMEAIGESDRMTLTFRKAKQ